MVSLLLTEMSKKNLFRQVFCEPSGNFLMVILSSNQLVHKKKFHFWLCQGIFCVFGVFRGFTGENGYYCLDITCEPSKIIARWSLMSLQGVLGDLCQKKNGGGAFLGQFWGKMVISGKKVFLAILTSCEPSKIIARWSLMSLQGVLGDLCQKKNGGGAFLGQFWGKMVISGKKVFLAI